MQKRRAERCIARAEEALAEGREQQAGEALEEARRLAPAETPDLETLRARLASVRLSAEPVAEVRTIDRADIDTLRAPAAPVDSVREVFQPTANSRARRVGAVAVLAAMAFLASGLGTLWFLRAAGEEPLQVAAPTPGPTTLEPRSPRPVLEAPPPAVPAGLREPSAPPQDPAVALPQPDPGARGSRETDTRTPAQKRPGSPDEDPVRVAVGPPPATVGTAGAEDLPLTAAAKTEVLRDVPAPAVVTPPVVPATPLDSVAPGTPVTAPAEPRPPAIPPPAPKRVEPTPEAAAEPRIRAVLSSYEAAFRSLDAAAVQRIWPGVDERALARAFEGLSSQSVSLGNCALAITGTSATAQCTGSTTWTPKVGSGARTVARRWQFALQSAGDGWQIVRADVR